MSDYQTKEERAAYIVGLLHNPWSEQQDPSDKKDRERREAAKADMELWVAAGEAAIERLRAKNELRREREG